jgi:hypothetical protein
MNVGLLGAELFAEGQRDVANLRVAFCGLENTFKICALFALCVFPCSFHISEYTAVISVKWHQPVGLRSKGKGKAIPLQGLTSPEVSRNLRPQDFKTIGT